MFKLQEPYVLHENVLKAVSLYTMFQLAPVAK